MGMLPANSEQLATFNKIVSSVGLVGKDAAALNSLLSAISTTGTVPAPSATADGATTLTWHAADGEHFFTSSAAPGRISSSRASP